MKCVVRKTDASYIEGWGPQSEIIISRSSARFWEAIISSDGQSMSGEQPSVDQATLEQTKQQIRGLVQEISHLAKNESSPEKFYAEFLNRVVSALAAVGGAIWTIDDQKRMQLAYQIRVSQSLLDPNTDEAQRHMRLLSQVLNSGEPTLAPPMSGATDEQSGGNPTQYLLVLALLRSDSQVEGLIEVFQRPDSSPSTQRGYLRFVLQMVELASEWFKSRRLRDYSDRQSLWGQADQFSRMVHESLDLPLTTYTIVNEGRRLLECDRVTLVTRRGGRCKIEAISGQDTIDKRSTIVATLRTLATRVVATGESLWYTGSTAELPPQVEEALEAYIEESHSKTVAVIPLHRPVERKHSAEADAAEFGPESAPSSLEVVGALIIEQIDSNVPRETLAVRAGIVQEHSARALSNSLDYSRVPLMSVWRVMNKSRWLWSARNLPKTIAVLLLLAGVGVAMALVPWDFRLRGKGELQPILHRDIFVSVEGTVVKVHKMHNDAVTAGEPLVTLENNELNQKYKDLLGQRDATFEIVNSVRDTLINNRNLSGEEKSRLNGQVAQQKVRLDSLEAQITIVEQQLKNLVLRSPITGRIVTWNVDELLSGRPVTTGQVVMTVADPAGPWKLDVFMPENRMGHVDRALSQRKTNDPLIVHYVTAVNPGRQLVGKIVEIHRHSQHHETEGQSVRLRVDIDKKDLDDPRPGSSVTAEVACGKRSVGYVLFHEVWEWIQTHVLF